VQRPGVSQPKGAAQEAVIQNPTEKLDAPGSLKDAAAIAKGEHFKLAVHVGRPPANVTFVHWRFVISSEAEGEVEKSLTNI